MTNNTAYIVVDVQNDFVEGGALGVDGGNAVGAKIKDFLGRTPLRLVAATRDWHINPGDHFKTWPVHCAANTPGAELTDDIKEALAGVRLSEVFSKGLYSDGYSGFDGIDIENNRPLPTALYDQNVSTVLMGGIATDYCVRATVLDALRARFDVIVISDHCVGIAPDTIDKALEEMRAAGAQIMTEAEYLTKEN